MQVELPLIYFGGLNSIKDSKISKSKKFMIAIGNSLNYSEHTVQILRKINSLENHIIFSYEKYNFVKDVYIP